MSLARLLKDSSEFVHVLNQVMTPYGHRAIIRARVGELLKLRDRYRARLLAA